MNKINIKYGKLQLYKLCRILSNCRENIGKTVPSLVDICAEKPLM